ncbi:hypothetical protein CFP56_021882 [Quercus suber]|uniref:Uncharacterized protein n=1 Tax=Quercus suber TaxID=58331 RepID=A0AAW0KGC1_QUESU
MALGEIGSGWRFLFGVCGWWSSWGLAFTMKGNKWDIGKDQVSGTKTVTLERGYGSERYILEDGANLECDADNIQLFLAEVKLAWIVHIVAAILKTLQISGQMDEEVDFGVKNERVPSNNASYGVLILSLTFIFTDLKALLVTSHIAEMHLPYFHLSWYTTNDMELDDAMHMASLMLKEGLMLIGEDVDDD